MVSALQSRQLAELGRRYGVAAMWVFGSVARGDAKPASDVDILIQFLPDSSTSTWEWPAIKDELGAIFGRDVDLLSMGVLSNPFRRESILATRKLLYAA